MKLLKHKLSKSIKKHLKSFKEDNTGIGSIEMVLILLVLVGLIVVFRENIMDIIDTIFDNITNQINNF